MLSSRSESAYRPPYWGECFLMGDWEEAQAGSKIAGRNLNNLRYADDTTLMAESEED